MLSSHVEELQSYVSQEQFDMLIAAGLTVLLWRGHFDLTLPGEKSVRLPVHSMVTFAWAILITQNYNRFPSFVLFSIAWTFLASMEQRRRHPSPWHQCKSYPDLFRALVVEICGACIGSRVASRVRKKQDIAPNTNINEILAYMEAEQKRKEVIAAEKLKQEAELEDEIKKHQEEMEFLEEDCVASAIQRSAGFFSSANLIKPILHPVQKNLYQACVTARIIKSIVTWEENYFTFWIVTALLAGSLFIFFIPWGFVLRWVMRVVVLLLTGPWMKVVDWYYFEQTEDMTPEERDKALQEQIKYKQQEFRKQRLLSRKQREEAVKLTGIMKYYFGKVRHKVRFLVFVKEDVSPHHESLDVSS